MEGMIVESQWSSSSEPSSESSHYEVNNPEVSEPASGIEALDWELSDHKESKSASKLSSSGVVCEIEVRSVDWSSHSIFKSLFGSWEP